MPARGHALQRSVSSPQPPAGLADGFGLEEPYGWLRTWRASPACRFTPGMCVGPRLPDHRTCDQELGGSPQRSSVSQAAGNGYQAWTLTETIVLTRRNKKDSDHGRSCCASSLMGPSNSRRYAHIVRLTRRARCLRRVIAGQTACSRSAGGARDLRVMATP